MAARNNHTAARWPPHMPSQSAPLKFAFMHFTKVKTQQSGNEKACSLLVPHELKPLHPAERYPDGADLGSQADPVHC